MLTHRKLRHKVHALVFNDDLAIVDRTLPLPCPAWAADTEKLKSVVAGKLSQIAHRGTELSTDLEAMRVLEQQATAMLHSSIHCAAIAKSVAAAERHGGKLAMLTTIAWRRFRLGQTSTTIAADLGITACVVRRQVASLAEVARRIYPDPSLHLPRKHNSKQIARPFLGGEGGTRGTRAIRQEKIEEMRRLRAQGQTYFVIARAVGCHYLTVMKYLKPRKCAALTAICTSGENFNGELTHAGI